MKILSYLFNNQANPLFKGFKTIYISFKCTNHLIFVNQYFIVISYKNSILKKEKLPKFKYIVYLFIYKQVYLIFLQNILEKIKILRVGKKEAMIQINTY